MKKSHKIISLLVLLVLAAAAGAFLHSNMIAMQENARKGEADAFTTSAIKAIAREWDEKEFDQRSHPLLLEGIKRAGNSTKGIFHELKELGALEKDGTCTFVHLASVTTPTERFATASYLCEIEFKNSPATFALDLRQDNMSGPWQIMNFNVNSPLFAKKKDGKKQ